MPQLEFEIQAFKNTPEDIVKAQKHAPEVWNMRAALYEYSFDQSSNPINGIFAEKLEVLFVATLESEVIGYAILDRDIDPDAMVLSEAFVDGRYRRKGVYKKLTEERIKVAKNQGMQKVYVSPNTAAQTDSYFLSMGFEYCAENKNPDDGLILDLTKIQNTQLIDPHTTM